MLEGIGSECRPNVTPYAGLSFVSTLAFAVDDDLYWFKKSLINV